MSLPPHDAEPDPIRTSDDSHETDVNAHDPLADQPLIEVERDGVHYTLLGTAHVSRASVDAVHALLAQDRFDAVAVELCESRYRGMRNPESLAALDLFRVVREGKTGMVAANLALSAYQRRLSEQLGVEPGAEMRAGFEGADQRGLPVWRIDRDVGITLRRTYAAVGWWDRVKLLSGLLASVLVDDGVDEAEIERLKQGDVLESTFAEFAQRSKGLHRALIAERDAYMAAALRLQGAAAPGSRVLAIVGAGHLAGLAEHLRNDRDEPAGVTSGLSAVPPPGRWGLWITLLLAVLLIGGFAWGFSQGTEVGADMVLNWVLMTGTLGAIGCTLAGGHPLSIVGAFIASPLTPLHPALSSGTVSALIEATVRRPTVADFSLLRDDVTSLRGWWRNRVARVLVNFFLTSLGTAIGVYIAGYQIIDRLL
jgi:pheromone shutdown-related protein TraB